MNIRSHLKCIMLTCATLMSAGSLFSAAVNPTGYYNSENLAELNDLSIRKHAPLAIFIDQNNEEDPQSESVALTVHFSRMLEAAFAPILVSRSIVSNYFHRRLLSPNDTLRYYIPNYKTIPLDRWSLYEVPHSQFLLFVPNYYVKYYRLNLGLKLNNLKNITQKLETDIYDYLKLPDNFPLFSVDNLRTVLNTIKISSESLTKSELKQQVLSPIWDIILNGHGNQRSKQIGGISINDMQELLSFFNNELTVGTFFIESCSAGGKNLTLLEFDESVNKDKIIRNLDYILIVGSIADAPTYVHDEDKKKFIKFYNNAALLQGRGTSLNRLLNDLTPLQRSRSSPHGTSDIPQIWLPGGLGFQTYQIDKKVQILNNVKVRKHENERSPIILPDSSVAALIYVDSIDVPILVTPRITDKIINSRHWKNIPSFAELFTNQQKTVDLDNLDRAIYPALTTFSYAVNTKENAVEKMNDIQLLMYPQFISMKRGQNTKQHFTKIELAASTEYTGVMHFLRDAFFDIGERTTKKIFYIDELIGANDISLLLELIRLHNKSLSPSRFELELRPFFDNEITLKAITIKTDQHHASLNFMFNDKLWYLYFHPSKTDKNGFTFWQFHKDTYPEEYLESYEAKIDEIYQNIPNQKSICEALRPSFHIF